MQHQYNIFARLPDHREDPSIFGYNLMNEPRSQSELYVVKRTTTDGSREYNISYNPANDLQSWIEDMATYIKSIDPIHLLSTGACSGCVCVSVNIVLPLLLLACCLLMPKPVSLSS